MGESRRARAQLAIAVRRLDVPSIPINILEPIPGTPLENIERIEVVAHPMGEYKVEDGCGVINLILKTREDEGIQYNLSVGDSQDYRNSQYGMLSVNYTKKKTFLTSGVSVNNANNKNETTFDYRFYDRQSQTWRSGWMSTGICLLRDI